jgi:Tfp pilus assembly protein PilO
MTLDNRLWILISTVVCIALLAGGWFIGVSPNLAAAAEADEQRAGVQAQNDSLRAELSSLRAASEEMPEMTGRLDKLQGSIPPGVHGSQFLAEFDRLVTGAGVTVESIALGAPARYEAPTADEASDASAAELLPQASPLVTADNFVTVPLDITVIGSNEQVLAFAGALQSATRLVLVTNVSMQRDADVEGGPSGQFTASFTGQMYVLESATAPAPTEEPSE